MVESTMPQQIIPVTYQFTTTNQSFLDMHYFLRKKGVENCKFFLALYDSDLLNINPRNPNLNMMMKQKVLRECLRNFWYFIREVVRIPASGGEVGGGIQYKLHRANLAMNFGFVLNWNMFVEIPRQNGKTVSALCWYLWIFLFGTRNSKMLFLHKKLEDSKMNLGTMRDIRNALPDYLQLDAIYNSDGKKAKESNSVETLFNRATNNLIKTAPSARNKMLASNLGRGATLPFIYFDEYAFIPFNYMIYQTAAPAFSKAADTARSFGCPYGILITTTPGDMLTDEGKEAYQTKEDALFFNELWYNMTPTQLYELSKCNPKSNFVYIRYNYRELGRTEEYFDEMVKTLKSNWTAIRREILLEWSESTENSPFERADLDTVKQLLRKPIRDISIGRPDLIFHVYKDGLFFKYPPIIGVDVAGGLNRDSSAITVIDTETTEVLAVFNNNYISPVELAKVIYLLVKNYMPNAVINIERNGGFGTSVIGYLKNKPDIRPNLYYEIKEVVTEERYDGMHTVRSKQVKRQYGYNETKENRNLLMEILTQRMQYHKDKFISEIIYYELTQLEVKKSGRIEHASNGHDDTIFSYLLALYVWYEGKNLMENWHIKKFELKTDSEFDEESDSILMYGSDLKDLSEDLVSDEEYNDIISSQMEFIKNTVKVGDLRNIQQEEDNIQLELSLQTDPLFRKAYCKKFNTNEDAITGGRFDTLGAINSFYDNENPDISELQQMFDSMNELR